MKNILRHFFIKFKKILVEIFKTTPKPKLKLNFANKKPKFPVNIKPKLFLVCISN